MLDVRHAPGTQHPHDLIHRDFAEVVRHDQVGQVVDVRQPLAVEAVDRNAAVGAKGLNVPARLLHIVRVGIQPVYQVAVAGSQGRRQSAVPATEVNDEPALHLGSFQNLPGQITPGAAAGRCGGAGDCRAQQHHQDRQGPRAWKAARSHWSGHDESPGPFRFWVQARAAGFIPALPWRGDKRARLAHVPIIVNPGRAATTTRTCVIRGGFCVFSPGGHARGQCRGQAYRIQFLPLKSDRRWKTAPRQELNWLQPPDRVRLRSLG